MTGDSGLPLASMILLSYNQQRFIGEALRGALSQDYERLEIIVSDDASTDDTWAVIEATTRNYRGPHRVVLNRNETNLGLMGNLMTAVGLARGEFLVAAAGDDISEATRVAKVMAAFSAPSARPVTLVGSNAIRIDEDGRQLPLQPRWPRDPNFDLTTIAVTGEIVGGAFAAYSRRVFDAFGEPDRRIVNEDAVFSLRAAILGRIVILTEDLLRYRRHSASISYFRKLPQTRAELVASLLAGSRTWQFALTQMRADVEWAGAQGLIAATDLALLRSHLERRQTALDGTIAALEGPGVLRRVQGVMRMRGEPLRIRVRTLLIGLAPWLYILMSRLKESGRAAER